MEATLFYLRTLREKINDDVKWGAILGLRISKHILIHDTRAEEFLKLPVIVKLLRLSPLNIVLLKPGNVEKIENGTYNLIIQCEECEAVSYAIMSLNEKERILIGQEQLNPQKTWNFGMFKFEKEDTILIKEVMGIGYQGPHTQRNLASFHVI